VSVISGLLDGISADSADLRGEMFTIEEAQFTKALPIYGYKDEFCRELKKCARCPCNCRRRRLFLASLKPLLGPRTLPSPHPSGCAWSC
jgi:hypothetical protein